MKVYDSVMFGQAIKLRRKEMKYTQRDISELTGFSISFISDLENGKSTAEIGKAIYISNVLGLDIEINSRGSR
jgi:transcriptional regulator with XRE-family HTH domain